MSESLHFLMQRQTLTSNVETTPLQRLPLMWESPMPELGVYAENLESRTTLSIPFALMEQDLFPSS